MNKTYNRLGRWCVGVTLALLWVLPLVALAQDDAGAAAAPAAEAGGGAADTATSWAQAFLWSEDPIGLAIIWILLLMSAISIGFSLKLFLTYRKSNLVPDDTAQQVEALLNEKRYREAIEYADADTSYLGRLISAALAEAAAGFGAMERAVEEEADSQTARMLRPIEYLNVLGNIGPMLGLFGTVYGMILAFQQLVAAGGKPDPAELAAGISTALVTTFWGLIVAIPALAVYAMIRNKIDALTSEGLQMAEELIRPFRPGAARKPAAKPAAKPAGEAPSA